MRVVSGSARGCKLQPVPGMSTRPTTDRVKENVFNLIQEHVRRARRYSTCLRERGSLGSRQLREAHGTVILWSAIRRHTISCVKIQKPPAWPTAPRYTGKRRPTLFPVLESGATA